MTEAYAPYRRQRPRAIKLKLTTTDGLASMDVGQALEDVLMSFHAPLPDGARGTQDGKIVLVTREVITWKELNRRYLVYLLDEMGEQR
jgi:hypothetical protein